jgi:hypothetical protein
MGAKSNGMHKMFKPQKNPNKSSFIDIEGVDMEETIRTEINMDKEDIMRKNVMKESSRNTLKEDMVAIPMMNNTDFDVMKQGRGLNFYSATKQPQDSIENRIATATGEQSCMSAEDRNENSRFEGDSCFDGITELAMNEQMIMSSSFT